MHLVEHLEHADVSRAARTAAGEHEADAGTTRRRPTAPCGGAGTRRILARAFRLGRHVRVASAFARSSERAAAAGWDGRHRLWRALFLRIRRSPEERQGGYCRNGRCDSN